MTASYVCSVVVLSVSLVLGRDPTGVEPIVWYGGAFGVMLAASLVSPTRGRGDRDSHLDRAPSWLKALPAVHGAGLLLAFGLLAAGVIVQPATIPLVLASFFGSVGTLMGWYGRFSAI